MANKKICCPLMQKHSKIFLTTEKKSLTLQTFSQNFWLHLLPPIFCCLISIPYQVWLTDLLDFCSHAAFDMQKSLISPFATAILNINHRRKPEWQNYWLRRYATKMWRLRPNRQNSCANSNSTSGYDAGWANAINLGMLIRRSKNHCHDRILRM